MWVCVWGGGNLPTNIEIDDQNPNHLNSLFLSNIQYWFASHKPMSSMNIETKEEGSVSYGNIPFNSVSFSTLVIVPPFPFPL